MTRDLIKLLSGDAEFTWHGETTIPGSARLSCYIEDTRRHGSFVELPLKSYQVQGFQYSELLATISRPEKGGSRGFQVLCKWAGDVDTYAQSLLEKIADEPFILDLYTAIDNGAAHHATELTFETRLRIIQPPSDDEASQKGEKYRLTLYEPAQPDVLLGASHMQMVLRSIVTDDQSTKELLSKHCNRWMNAGDEIVQLNLTGHDGSSTSLQRSSERTGKIFRLKLRLCLYLRSH